MSTLATFIWNGETMTPMGRFRDKCKEAFTPGEYYKLEVMEERSWVSHKHYFACLHDAWVNLPSKGHALEPWAQSVKHFRKYALIRTGWNNAQTWTCGSRAEADRMATALRSIASDDFAIVAIEGTTVTRFTAKSQSMKAMGKEDFQKSKDDVLTFVADLIGADPGQLGSAA